MLLKHLSQRHWYVKVYLRMCSPENPLRFSGGSFIGGANQHLRESEVWRERGNAFMQRPQLVPGELWSWGGLQSHPKLRQKGQTFNPYSVQFIHLGCSWDEVVTLGDNSFLGPKAFPGEHLGWAMSATNALGPRRNESIGSEKVSGQCRPLAITGPGLFRLQD